MTTGVDRGLPADMREIGESFAVSGQISLAHVRAIADAGFSVIICNRPDGEAPDQPGAAQIETEARRLGLAFHYIPVFHSGLTSENVEATRRAVSQADGPIFAYCRSGARSSNLHALTMS
ncbi:TIGR01244 family sulfur transferase [Oricola cellulosilytica]|uniref:TIGR01244 family phosphatase n=1 Tax=Oricola cellulosilytica TaxID=1429082 RepID=A0A4R0PIV2_9HYPH|nr:TIGR01244 family sulfur transferase [Oricola cellulosilytica]TCD16653.1 TIGR01244 family phosphatase [Oricola cellulosilytica]